MGELHTIVLWPNAVGLLNKLVEDLNSSDLIVRKIFKITWDSNKFEDNLSIFYYNGSKRNFERKIRECGTGPFHLIVIEDFKPIYEKRDTSRGHSLVNVNLFDNYKIKYRTLLNNRYIVHSSDSVKEASTDLILLTGLSNEEFRRVYSNNDLEVINLVQNVTGLDGYKDLTQFFNILNNSINYIVLRNFESFPNTSVKEHPDIDLLLASTKNYVKLVYLTNARKKSVDPTRINHIINISKRDINFDFRYVGDDYYCKRMQNMLISHKINNNGFCRPSDIDYFYSLLYHALIHKKEIKEDYKERLTKMAADLKLDFALDNAYEFLKKYMKEHDFEFVRPQDHSVGFNKED